MFTALGAAATLSVAGLSAPAYADSVYASWEFDEVGGVVRDQLAGGNDLNLTGNWSSVAGTGADASAIRFGAHPVMAATSSADGRHFNPGLESFALTLTMRTVQDVASGTSPNVAQHGHFSAPGQIKMQLAPGGKVGCRIKGSRAAYLFYHRTANVNDNRWHTVTCARNEAGTDVSVTVDGVIDSPAGSQNPGNIVVEAPLSFGMRSSSGSSDQFLGDISYASYSI